MLYVAPQSTGPGENGSETDARPEAIAKSGPGACLPAYLYTLRPRCPHALSEITVGPDDPGRCCWTKRPPIKPPRCWP